MQVHVEHDEKKGQPEMCIEDGKHNQYSMNREEGEREGAGWGGGRAAPETATAKADRPTSRAKQTNNPKESHREY
jgi:hypothetical protein